MASDIINGKSPNELSREIQLLIAKDQRSLPDRSKIFAAIAKIQQFDVLPDIGETEELNKAIEIGCIELNRGLAAGKGIPAHVYAKELLYGAMYPGTLTAYGNGVYFAAPSKPGEKFEPFFPRISIVALKYTAGETYGALLRASIKKDAKVIEFSELKQYLRENKNRAKRAGITDIGAFAAALGFDAIFADGAYDDCDERIYTVLNRGALLVQKTGVMVMKND